MPFTGHIAELPLGYGGFTGTHNQSQVMLDQLIQADTVTFESGTLQKEGGAVKYNATVIAGTPQIMGGHDWNPTTVLQRAVVVTSDSKIQKDSGTFLFPTLLKALANQPSTPPVFVDGGKEVAANNRKLFIHTGNNVVQVLSADGVATTDLASPPADWAGTNQPTAGCIHNNRNWGWGNLNDPHRVYYTTAASHEDFLTGGAGNAGSIRVYSGEGDGIKSAVSFKGHLIVFKSPRGIYDVDTTAPDPANWGVTRISRAIGAPGYYACVNIDDDIVFIDCAGVFHRLSAVREYGDFSLQALGDTTFMTPYIRDTMALAFLPKMGSTFYTAKREVHFTMARIGSSTNNARLVIDLNDPNRMRFRYSYRDTMQALWMRKDSDGVDRLAGGDQAGFMWLMDQATKTKDGVAYVSTFQTPHYDLSHLDPKLATKRKTGVAIEMVVEPKGNWTIGMDIYWDGKYFMSTTFNMGVTGAALGSFVLDTDVLGNDQVLNRKRRIAGSGRRLSLVGNDSGSGTDFSLSRCFLHYKMSDERVTK